MKEGKNGNVVVEQVTAFLEKANNGKEALNNFHAKNGQTIVSGAVTFGKAVKNAIDRVPGGGNPDFYMTL